jgi:hypothetical protein
LSHFVQTKIAKTAAFRSAIGARSFSCKGTKGRRRDVLTAGELAQYATTAANVLTPDCRAWLERE